MDVDTVLTRLEALIRDARAVPMSASCMVHRDDVLDLIEDARRSLPSQLGDAQKVLTQRDAVVAEARDQSKAIIDSAYAEQARLVAEDAVLNANYILRSLEDLLEAPFGKSGPCMHEALFSDKGFAEGLSTLDLAKGLIDEGYHPMTMYFPLVVHGAMLIEPTETESKAALDQFIGALRSVALRARQGDPSLKSAPHFAPRRRLDETQAARKPVLSWKGE